jgi:two-component system, chemotaxis family, chemotaxis protein CheY
MKILIVDDELVSRSKMKKILSGFGTCDAFQTGSEAKLAFAKALTEHDPYRLVTLDIAMPGKDGMEVLFELRELETSRNPDGENTKIIMVTANTDKDTIITCLQAGCDDYVIKPFNMEIMGKKLVSLGFDV